MEHELRIFLSVVSEGTFTRGAQRVGRTQPSVTAAIQRLEAWAGARLLERGPRQVQLTEAGRALLPHAHAALAALDDAQRAIAQLMGLERGEVRVGAGATACAELLPPVLAAFRSAHPHITVQLREGHNDTLRRRLRAGELDLIITTDLGDSPHGEPWRRDELLLVAAPGVGLGPLVTFWEGSSVRAHLDRGWPGAPVAMELSSVDAVRAHALAGVGPALLSAVAVQRELASGALVPLPHPAFPVWRQLLLEHRGVDRLPPSTAALRRVLLEESRG